jgi:endonuclease YncB( thermonuclease family)
MSLKKALMGVVFSSVLASSSCYSFEPGKAYRCTRVVDGDTAYFDGLSRRVRFQHVNTPEMDTAEGVLAREYVNERILGEKIVLNTDFPDDYPSMDRSGRWLATLYLDGKNFSEELIEEGLSRYYNKFSESYLARKYRRAEIKAKVKRRKFWKNGRWPYPNDRR